MIMLCLYFRNNYHCPDDLAEAIINSYENYKINIVDYSVMLQEFVRILKQNMNTSINQSMLEKLREMVNNLFDTIVVRDSLEYLKDVNEYYQTSPSHPEYVNEGEKEKIHSKNVTACFRIVESTYSLLRDTNLLLTENFLSIIKKKTETILENNSFKEDNLLILSLIDCITEIVRYTNRSHLLRVFGNLDYYPFLTKLIRSTITDPDFMETGIMLVGFLSDTDVLWDQCPFDENETPQVENNLVYDFILPIITNQIENCFYFLTGLEVMRHTDEQHIEQYQKWFWVMGRIIFNDIFRNGGEKSLSQYDNVAETIFHILVMLGGKICTGLIESIMVTLLIISSKRMEVLAPKLALFLDNIFSVIVLPTLDRQGYTVFFSRVLELLDYLMDNEIISIGPREMSLTTNLPEIYNSFSIYLKLKAERVLLKMASLFEMNDSDDDTEEESEHESEHDNTSE
ncbi:predicted protein [Naegleria gruberi]|uniref:Predicted protein n=1 Tax=Naegleria gruberi TaxID=5762 RepID=D2VDN7_NAEGR|nr:uncharacterized protein NAEGRDRAFT_66984 [Naegleria gruberi]EFC44930.1 predicted protein [Naegleria gruberi]|eukprot:XP_002677674.1 predicted protein [Naegleria gruberi strain NEG-M]